MTMNDSGDLLHVLYRGPLASCNYDCFYCPFAKHRSDADELRRDREALASFSSWATTAPRSLAVLITPWGEGLIRRWYQEALVILSHAPNVRKIAIQTNLSCDIDFLENASRAHVGLWCTFHPTEARLETFLGRCEKLLELGISFSIGIVGLRENRPWAERLRRHLPEDVYVWVNAYKSEGPDYYNDEDLVAFESLDPLFPINNQRHPSRGRACQAGQTAISVDGDGNVRRCHFVDRILGNLYEQPLEEILGGPRPCPNATCGCHIGYVHLDELGLRSVFGDRLPERVPLDWPA